MFVNPKLKLNKYVVVRIPSNRDYFSRFGMISPNNLSFSGDNVVDYHSSKMDSISQALNDYNDFVNSSE